MQAIRGEVIRGVVHIRPAVFRTRTRPSGGYLVVPLRTFQRLCAMRTTVDAEYHIRRLSGNALLRRVEKNRDLLAQLAHVSTRSAFSEPIQEALRRERCALEQEARRRGLWQAGAARHTS